MGGASGAAGEGDARSQADGVSPAGQPWGGGISLRTPNKTFEYINRNYSSVPDNELLRISFSRQDKHTALVSFLHKSVVSLSLAVSLDGRLLFCSISVRKTRQKAENKLLLSTSKHY